MSELCPRPQADPPSRDRQQPIGVVRQVTSDWKAESSVLHQSISTREHVPDPSPIRKHRLLKELYADGT